MAISLREFRQMQKEIRAIKRQLMRASRQSGLDIALPRPHNAGERADQVLRAAGLLSEPTSLERRRVAQWQATPIEKRKRLVSEFRALKLEKPLSQIVVENRR